MNELFKLGLPSLVAIIVVLTLLIILKFVPEIKSTFKFILKFFGHHFAEPTASELLDEVKQLRSVIEKMQETINAQRTHIDKIESYLEKNKELIETIEKIMEHPAKIYLDSLGLSIGFVDTLRPRDSEDIQGLLFHFKNLVGSFPFANRKLTLELLDVRFANVNSTSAIGNLFSKTAEDNDMRLRVVVPKKSLFDKLIRNLHTFREVNSSDNVEIKEVEK